MTFFGRAGGPARLIWAVTALGVLLTLAFVIVTLNGRLDNQQGVNRTTVDTADQVVDVNDDLTNELSRLTDLTRTARTAVDATRNLAPLLADLDTAIGGAARLLRSTASGTQISNSQLTTISELLVKVQHAVLPLVDSAAAFGGQADQLLVTARGLVGDLRSAVESARTINQMLPLPG